MAHASAAAAAPAAAAPTTAKPAPRYESASSIAALSLAPLLAAAATAAASGSTSVSAALADRTELLAGGAFGRAGFVDGVGSEARFCSPAQMALQRGADGAAVAVVLSDRDNHAVRRLHLQSGRVETLACRPQMRPTHAGTAVAAAANPSSTAPASASSPAAPTASMLPLLLPLSSPSGVVLDPQSAGTWLLLADGGNHLIRKLWLPTDNNADGGYVAPLSALPRPTLWAGGAGGGLGWENEGDDEAPPAPAPAPASGSDESAAASAQLYAKDTGSRPAERPMTARRRLASRMAEEEAAAATAAAAAASSSSGSQDPSRAAPPVPASAPIPAPLPTAAAAAHTVVASAARFSRPSGLCWDASSNVLVCDRGNRKLKKVSAAGMVSQLLPAWPSLAPDDFAPATDAAAAAAAAAASSATVTATAARQLFGPECVAIDARNNVLVADTAGHCVRRLAPSGACTVLVGVPRTPGFRDAPSGAGGGSGSGALFSSPRGLAVDPRSQCIFVADSDNHAIRLITPQGAVLTIAGKGAFEGGEDADVSASSAGGTASARPVSASARPSSAAAMRSYSNRAPPSPVPHSSSSSAAPLGLGLGAEPGAETEPEEGFVDGLGGHARFFRPEGLAYDARTDTLYVCDSGNNCVRRLRIEREDPAAGETGAGAADAAAAAAAAGFGALVPPEPFPSARLMPGHHQQHDPASPSRTGSGGGGRGPDAQLNRHASMPSFRSPLTARPATASAAVAAARPSSSDSIGRRWGGVGGSGGGVGGGGSGAGASPPSLDAPPLPTDPHSWSRVDVAFWLLSLSPAFETYVSSFHASRIDGAALLSGAQGRAGDALLQRLGVASKTHRNAILRAVLRLVNPGEDEAEEQADSGAEDSAAALDESGEGGASARGSGPSSRVGSASATRPHGLSAGVHVRPTTAGGSGWRPSSASVSSRASAAAESLLSAMHLSDPQAAAAPRPAAAATAELALEDDDLPIASD